MAGTAAAAVPGRQRGAGHASARSLLTVLLGEFALPHEQPVWTSVLVDALAMFDVEEKSARQALARVAAEGWLTSERVGRRVRWILTPGGRHGLAEGTTRTHTFGSEPAADDWDGTWLVLLASVPESRRELRHRLRTRLGRAGFGSPAPGVWITPHTAREPAALDVLEELGLAGDAMSFTAAYGVAGTPESMVSRAWDLGELARTYEEFTAEFTALRPAGDTQALHALTRLVHAWRRFPALDPMLPQQLLPARWSGTEAAALFHRRHTAWLPGARRHWDRLGERT